MRGDETTIQIFGREMKVEIEGLTPMEISAVAQLVTEKMREIQAHTGTPDTSKLAMLACLHFAAELQHNRRESHSATELDGRKVDQAIETLKKALK